MNTATDPVPSANALESAQRPVRFNTVSDRSDLAPEDCRFHCEFRNLPGAGAEAMPHALVEHAACLEPAMRALHPGAGFRFEPIASMPTFWATADDPAVQLAQRLSGNSQTTLVALGTEAGLFLRAGMSTVVCGPGHIAQARQADEYVSLGKLAACEAFLARLRSS